MGDADLARGIVLGNQANEMEEAIEDLQDNLNTLQLNLQQLELRTLQQLQDHMRDHMRIYFTFRCFVIAINFIFIPVIMAVGFSCMLKKIIDPDAQDALQGIIQILWVIAASLGAPLYLGSIWAVYNLPEPYPLVEEESPGGFAMVDDFDFFEMLMRQPIQAALPYDVDEYEISENQQIDNHRNEEDDEAADADDETEAADYAFEEANIETGETENEAEEHEGDTEGERGGIEEIESQTAEVEDSKDETDEPASSSTNQEHLTYDADLQPETYTDKGSATNGSDPETQESDDILDENDNTTKAVTFQMDSNSLTPETAETPVA